MNKNALNVRGGGNMRYVGLVIDDSAKELMTQTEIITELHRSIVKMIQQDYYRRLFTWN